MEERADRQGVQPAVRVNDMDHHHLFEVGGAKLSRLEDLRLIKGEGCYSADWSIPRQAHAAFLRADRAHAKILSVNTDAARKAKGVIAVYTGADAVKAGYVKPMSFLTFAGKDGKKANVPERPVLTHDRVRFVGDLVAMVVAETALQAQDAAGLIEVEYPRMSPSFGWTSPVSRRIRWNLAHARWRTTPIPASSPSTRRCRAST